MVLNIFKRKKLSPEEEMTQIEEEKVKVQAKMELEKKRGELRDMKRESFKATPTGRLSTGIHSGINKFGKGLAKEFSQPVGKGNNFDPGHQLAGGLGGLDYAMGSEKPKIKPMKRKREIIKHKGKKYVRYVEPKKKKEDNMMNYGLGGL